MLTIFEYASHFGFKTIVGTQTSLKRPIKTVEIDRPGLELTGFFDYHQKDRLILLGNKEFAFIGTMSAEEQGKVFAKLCNESVPGIIVCQGKECPPALKEKAAERDVAVFSTRQRTCDTFSDSITYLSEKLAPRTSVHACLLEVFSEGVLLMGKSGIGKSETSLELIKKGHCLVSDDKVDISLVRDKLIGRAPELILGMMEVRGIGIIDVPRMFGINSLKQSSRINFAINLVPFTDDLVVERIGMKTEHIEILGEKLPCITLPVSAARSMAEIIEAAVTNFKLKRYGYDSAYEFEKRMRELSGGRKERNR